LVPWAVAGFGVGLLLISFGGPAHLVALGVVAFVAVLRLPTVAALVGAAGATSTVIQVLVWLGCAVGRPGQSCMDVGFARLLAMAVLIAAIGAVVIVRAAPRPRT